VTTAGPQTNKTAVVPDPTASGLRVALVRITRGLRLHANSEMTPSQTSALARIEQVEAVRLGILASLEGVSSASMSKIVDALEALGYVERVADPSDGRASEIRVSPQGHDHIYALRAANTQMLEQVIATLSPDDVDVLRRCVPVLERVAEGLHEMPIDSNSLS